MFLETLAVLGRGRGNLPQLRLERGATSKELGWAVPAALEGAGGDGAGRKLKPGPGHSAGDVASHQLGRIHAAMVEMVAERGYDAVTVRELTRRAGVSSRSFYQHYSGKEACFLEAHDLVALKGLRRLRESQADAGDVKSAVRLAVRGIACDWGSAPGEARLLLIDSYGAGERAREQLQRVDLLFKTQLEQIVIEADSGQVASNVLARGIVDGLTAVACSRLLSKDGPGLADLADGLAEWASAYCTPFAEQRASLEGNRCLGRPRHASNAVPLQGLESEGGMAGSNSDRALLLSATVKLASSGQATIAPEQVAVTAGISRKAFYANFPDTETCVAAAVDSKMADVMRRMQQAAGYGGTPTTGVYRALASLCDQLASDPVLSEFCFGDTVSAMIVARLRLQSILAAGLGGLMAEAMPGRPISALSTEASVGALWGALRRLLGGGRRSSKDAPQLAAHLTYLLAPTIETFSAIDATPQERALSVA